MGFRQEKVTGGRAHRGRRGRKFFSGVSNGGVDGKVRGLGTVAVVVGLYGVARAASQARTLAVSGTAGFWSAFRQFGGLAWLAVLVVGVLVVRASRRRRGWR